MTAASLSVSSPGWIKKWTVAIRPFALPASTTPVLFGTAMAAVLSETKFNLPLALLALLALLAMILLHSGANMLSDVNDYRKGMDTVELPGSGAIVRGFLTSEQVLRGALLLLVMGTILGIILVLRVGWPLLTIGLAGLFIGTFYTARPFALKYHALGDAAVFFDFGILGALGAWTVQTGSFSWLPVIWTVPISLLVVGILHANNWRDAITDRQAKVRTMAGLLGDRGSLVYYGLLIFGAFAFVAALVALRFVAPASRIGMPATFLIVFLALPSALRLFRKALRRASPEQPLDFIALDGATAQLNLVFGLLCTGAILLHSLLQRLSLF